MGKVLATFQVMPKSVDVDLSKVKAQIQKMKDLGEIKDIKEEPIAFGLKCLKVLTMFDDIGGIVEKIEGKLKTIKDVDEARCIDVTLA